MNRSNFQSIKDVLKDVLKEDRFRTKLGEAKLIEYWGKAVGETIEKETSNLYIKNKKLFVKISSPLAKNDLMYRRKELINILNNHVEENIINDIIFL